MSPGSFDVPQVFPVDDCVAQSPDRRRFLRLAVGIPAAAVLGSICPGSAIAEEAAIAAHKGVVSFLAILPDESLLLSMGADSAKKWTLPNGIFGGQLFEFLTGGTIYMSPSGQRLVGIGQGGVQVLNCPSARKRGEFTEDIAVGGYPIVAISPDDKWLAVANGFEIALAKMGEAEGYEKLNTERRIQGRSGFISHLAFIRSQIVESSRNGTVCTWSFPLCEPLGRYETGKALTTMLLIEEPPMVATGHEDGTVILISLPSGKTIATLRANAAVVDLGLGPVNSTLASGSVDGTVDVWSLSNFEHLTRQQVSFSGQGMLTSLATNPKADLIAVGSSSGQIVLLKWPDLAIITHLFDRQATPIEAKGVTFTARSASGQIITYTLPCGSSIPPGATCVCNCVPGTSGPPIPTYAPPTLIVPSGAPPTYNPPTTVPGQTMTLPCTPTPIPPGYTCTCNCVPGR